MAQFPLPTRRPRPAFAASAAGLAIVAVAATALAVGGRAPSTPSGPPETTPPAVAATTSAAPSTRLIHTTAPTTATTLAPTHTNSTTDPAPIHVDLETFDRHDVRVEISDLTGLLRSATSGSPADGASVETGRLLVQNVDASQLRVKWTDYPIDNADALTIEWFDGRLRLGLVQPAPRADTDTVAFDRELILMFSEPIDAADVDASVVKGLDTDS